MEGSSGLVSDVARQVEDLIVMDDEYNFVACVKAQLEKERCGISKVELCPSQLLMLICSHHAVNCATVLIEGETGLAVDLNVPFQNGLYPIHYAAQHLSPSLTELLLQHGARTNLCCRDSASKYAGMLPLSMALETICNKRFLLDWAPHKSIFKLIYILCLPELEESLETIELLASNTEELPEISASIVQEVRLVELAVLLMVARKKLMTKVAGAHIPHIEHCIMRELQLINDEEIKLLGGGRYSRSLRICKRKKNMLLSASLILAVFNRAGGVLEKYRLSERIQHIDRYRLAVEIAICLRVLGFNLKRKDIRVDDIRCFLSKLGSEEAGHLKMKLPPESHFSNPAAPIFTFDFLNKGAYQHLLKYDLPQPNENIFDFILAQDDKERLVKKIKFSGTNPSILDQIGIKFLKYDSAKCATAVINGETGPILDYNAALCFEGLPALHSAAAFECPALTKLFLEHNGAEADLRCDCTPIGMEGMQLPLDVALDMIRKGEGIIDWNWNGTHSVFKLVFRLCAPHLRLCLETVRLLAQKTNEIGKEIYYYAKEGKVVELATLLMVAHEKVLTTPLPLEDNFGEMARIRPFLLAEIASLSVLDVRSMYALGNKKEVQQWQKKKAWLVEMLQLVEIFERIGEQLAKYLQLEQTKYSFEKLAKEVAWIFEEGGFDVGCDTFEDIQRQVAHDIWYHKYIGEFLKDGLPYMQWKAFDDPAKSYKPLQKRSDSQVLSASGRASICRSTSSNRASVSGSRMYHALPIAKTAMKFEPMTRAKKIEMQNLEFHKLFRGAFTRAFRHA